MIAGRIFCTTWGTRDFNNVHPIAHNCAISHAAGSMVALAGPMVNYICIWAGTILIRSARSSSRLSWGMVLIFANLPFARLITALFGGGDEIGVAKSFISDPLTARLMTIAIIIALLVYPLYTAFKALHVNKNRGWYFTGFLLLPMLLEGMVVLLFFNYLLKVGLLDKVGIMGAPVLVHIVLLVAFFIFVLFARHINSLVREGEN